MTSEFRPAMDYVLWNECDDMTACGKRVADIGGGFVNDKRDRGGATVYGLSKVIRDREGVTPAEIGIPNFSDASLRLTTREAAESVYRRIYWDAYRYEQLACQDVATKIMDAAVNINFSPPRVVAHRLAQQAANALGCSLSPDGILGPHSIDGINSLDPQRFLAAFVAQLVAFYEAIIAAAHERAVAENDPEQECWRGIWMARAHRVPT